MKLYELALEYDILADLLVSDDGEVSPEAEKALDSLTGEISVKVDGICSLIRQFSSDADAADAEKARLQALAVSRYRASDRLKAYLKHNLETLGMVKFETQRFRVRIQKNGRPSISWTGEVSALPPELKRTTVEFHGQQAYEFWRGGVLLPDGVVVDHGTHLRIS